VAQHLDDGKPPEGILLLEHHVEGRSDRFTGGVDGDDLGVGPLVGGVIRPHVRRGTDEEPLPGPSLARRCEQGTHVAVVALGGVGQLAHPHRPGTGAFVHLALQAVVGSV
jgi:hypothetical protein